MKHNFKHGQSRETCTCVLRDYSGKRKNNEVDLTWCECGYCRRCGRYDRGFYPMQMAYRLAKELQSGAIGNSSSSKSEGSRFKP